MKLISRLSPSRRALWFVLIITLIASLAGCSHNNNSAPDTTAPANLPAVSIATVNRGTIILETQATGTITSLPGHEATLAPQVSGVLISMPATLGAHVTGGDLVAQISPTLLLGQIQQAQATLDQSRVQVMQAKANWIQQVAQTRASILQALATERNAEASLGSAKATLTGDIAALTNAQSSLTREQNLLTIGLVPQKDVETARLAVQTAQAQVDAQRQAVNAQMQTVLGQKQAVEAAKAAQLQDDVKRSDIAVARSQVDSAAGALATLQAQRALYTLRAPISGYPTMIGATVGSSVDTTTKLITITDTYVVQVQLAVPTSSARAVKPGQSVTFTSESLPGKVFYSRIQSVSTQVDPTTGTIQALGTIANPKGILKDDMTISAQIVVSKHVGAVEAPEAAVLVDATSGDETVDTVDDTGVLHSVPVKTGIKSGRMVEILSGVEPGQRIAVSGQFGLTDGTRVTVASTGASQ